MHFNKTCPQSLRFSRQLRVLSLLYPSPFNTRGIFTCWSQFQASHKTKGFLGKFENGGASANIAACEGSKNYTN